MKLAISNIAWEKHDDSDVLNLLKANGVTGIEVAPTKLWQDWKGASYKKAREYKNIIRNTLSYTSKIYIYSYLSCHN